MARDFSTSTSTDDNANEKEDQEEEDYIDIEVSSSSAAFFCYSITSSHPREFEFQMSSKSLERDITTSPADELFYKGNLLPLHLPPRLQMVQKLLNNNNNNTKSSNYEKKSAADEDENFTTPLTTTNTTPFESCNISPADSCRVSRELNRDEYFLECGSTEMSGFIDENPKKSWSKKLKLIRKSSLGLKLKASSAYLKSLFSKSGCSEESCAEAAKNRHERAISKTKECLNKYIKVGKKNPFGQIQKGREQLEVNSIEGTEKEKMIEDNGSHRRSFSGAIKRHSATKSSSSLSSSGSSSSSLLSSTSSNGFYELHMLKRSNSANSEIETSIQGAIAHCKQSQQIFCSRKNPSEVGFCSFSASKIAACEEQERPQICRG